jgi:hypothetical protein
LTAFARPLPASTALSGKSAASFLRLQSEFDQAADGLPADIVDSPPSTGPNKRVVSQFWESWRVGGFRAVTSYDEDHGYCRERDDENQK